jgi:hypothetical protein
MYSKYYIVLSYHKNHFVRKIFLFLKNPSTYFVPLKSFCKKFFSKKKKKKSKGEREREREREGHYSINGKQITNVRLA